MSSPLVTAGQKPCQTANRRGPPAVDVWYRPSGRRAFALRPWREQSVWVFSRTRVSEAQCVRRSRRLTRRGPKGTPLNAPDPHLQYPLQRPRAFLVTDTVTDSRQPFPSPSRYMLRFARLRFPYSRCVHLLCVPCCACLRCAPSCWACGVLVQRLLTSCDARCHRIPHCGLFTTLSEWSEVAQGGRKPLPLSRRASSAVCSPRPRRASSAPPSTSGRPPRWERRLRPLAAAAGGLGGPRPRAPAIGGDPRRHASAAGARCAASGGKWPAAQVLIQTSWHRPLVYPRS